MGTTERIGVDDGDAEALCAALVAAGVPAERLLDLDRAGADDLAAVTLCLARPDRIAARLPSLPRLAWIQSTWAGVGPLLPALEDDPAFVVTTPKGVFGALMAEYALGWITALERRLPEYRDQQAQRRWAPLPARSLEGRTLVLVGLGSIGRRVAAVAAAFGLHVRGVSRTGTPVDGIPEVWPASALRRAAEGADYLVSVVPETAQTRGLIDAAVLGALAPGAILVNGGRGSVLVESDLLDAVRSAHLGAAVLDVFEEEPLPTGHPFWTTPGIQVTPHVAAPSRPEDIAGAFLANLERWEAGEPLAGVVEAERGY
jgi:phosphoglycerate dehydrogenase-like enzyme